MRIRKEGGFSFYCESDYINSINYSFEYYIECMKEYDNEIVEDLKRIISYVL